MPKGGKDPTESLPDHIDVIHQAKKELLRLDRGAAAELVDTLELRAENRHLPRNDEALPVGKGQNLRCIRTTYGGSEYRLAYMLVEPVQQESPRARAVVVEISESRPIRFVGLLAQLKNQTKFRLGKTAWKRSEMWLEEHPDYRRA
jgi:hypothetical protein